MLNVDFHWICIQLETAPTRLAHFRKLFSAIRTTVSYTARSKRTLGSTVFFPPVYHIKNFK